jgi:hypothetical protein
MHQLPPQRIAHRPHLASVREAGIVREAVPSPCTLFIDGVALRGEAANRIIIPEAMKVANTERRACIFGFETG